MDEFEEISGFEEYAHEITTLLSNEKILPFPEEYVVYEEIIRQEAKDDIVSEIPIPPNIQRLLVEMRDIKNTIRLMKSWRMGYSAPAMKLRKKHKIFKKTISLWVGSLLNAMPALVQTLGQKDFSYHVCGDWTLVFIQPPFKLPNENEED